MKQKPGSVGRAIMGTKIKIDSDGQILAHGPTLAQGYVDTTEPLVDTEGWYPTGDLGRFDEEEIYGSPEDAQTGSCRVGSP
ncbi:MAG: hypothetical protein CM1200mP14_11390 [Gammaproteobacteria bacterium]|nr:MAG: hypothetical protein CM1200mP14_11390 [Gammaproteobacteria bacterium]